MWGATITAWDRYSAVHMSLTFVQRESNRSPMRSPRNETTSPIDEAPGEKKGIFNRSTKPSSPQKQAFVAPLEDEAGLPDHSDFVFVESPNSKARAARALQKEQSGPVDYTATQAADMELLMDTPVQNGKPARPAKTRTKTLPMPPVGPVLPDFDDLMPTRTVSRDEGVKRKTSVVKKFKDRMK